MIIRKIFLFEKKDRIEGALSREYIKMFSKQMNVVMDEDS